MGSEGEIADLFREFKQTVEMRLSAVGRVKEIAAALKKLGSAIDRRPDFEAVSRDSILHEYLDLSRIAALVFEESELSAKQQDYESRLRALNVDPWP